MSRPRYFLRFLGIAEEDLSEIVAYIAVDNPVAADGLATKIEKNLSYLTGHPQLGKIPDDVELARLRYRYLIVDNYLIFYTIEKRTILVHRVIHGARDYEGML